MEPHSSPNPAPALRSRGLFATAALALVAFYLVGAVSLDGFRLGLGSINFPDGTYVLLVAFWAVLGGLAVALLALGAARRWGAPDRADRILEHWTAISDGRFLALAGTAAFALPLWIGLSLLRGAPLADDESAYRFAAELLASGRLWAASPQLKLFFDQNFMINDGRLYPVYFLGWPALMVPGAWVGATWIINPICSALTVPPLLRSLQQFVGSAWARAGVVIFLASPFVLIMASTELSHTSCLMAMTWSLWLCLRSRREGARAIHHAGFALTFALAFTIRPQVAVGMGLPLLVYWISGLRRMDSVERRRALLAFALPATLLATLFLGSLWAQNGSPLRFGYAAYADYMRLNSFRFTSFNENDLTALAGFDFSQIGQAVARTAAGVFRLNFDLFGWPSSLAFVLLALPTVSRRVRLLWAMSGLFLLVHMFQRDWGIDTFGPTHAFELALPILGLTIIGARNLGKRLTWAQGGGDARPAWRWSAFSPALLGALVTTAWLGFVPIRLAAVRQIASQIDLALDAPARAGIHNAVVFASLPFAPPCPGIPRHFVFFRPTNDPDLRNDVLWVNHLDIASNRRLLETLPGRTGYVLQWTPNCAVQLVPLDLLSPARAEPGDDPS